MTGGFQPPPYPYDEVQKLRAVAEVAGGSVVDLSVGNPCDPLPAVVADALVAGRDLAVGYPPSAGSPELRKAAAGWLGRRLGVAVDAEAVVPCVGTKELVASLPRLLHLRDPSRDTVLYPGVAYPTYAMGADLAGLRAVAVPLDERWCPDVGGIDESDASRALVLWLNEPGNPTGSVVGNDWYAGAVSWARQRGIVVASDECYVEFVFDAPRSTALEAGTEGVLSVHSLSKRSNMAGLRAGFVAGDADLVGYVREVRKHAGMMVPGPVQAAAAAALDDDAHVDEQLERYRARRDLVLGALPALGLVHDGGPGTFYLWVRHEPGDLDGWALATAMAEAGTLVSPGDIYGPDGTGHVRLALVQPFERVELALERLADRLP